MFASFARSLVWDHDCLRDIISHVTIGLVMYKKFKKFWAWLSFARLLGGKVLHGLLMYSCLCSEKILCHLLVYLMKRSSIGTK